MVPGPPSDPRRDGDHPVDPDDPIGPDGTALRRLLDEAVADVRPADRLGEIRRRTAQRRRSGRRWLPVVVGAGVATAAVVGGVAGLGSLSSGPTDRDDAPAASPGTQLVQATAVYFVGDTPDGPRLFREFQPLPAEAAVDAIDQALSRVDPTGGPADPDYRTLWPAGAFADVTVGSDRITVTLGSEEALDRPAGVSAREARLGVQQVVYTADAAVARTLPIAFEHDGAPARRVLGVEVEELIERDRQYDVLSPVNVSDPAEGTVVEGDVLRVRGTTTESVDSVTWQVETAGGTDDVQQGIGAGTFGGEVTETPAETGGMGWEADIDLTHLDPGEYRLVVTVRGTGQTTDRPGRYRDTRTFVVR